VVVKVTGTVVIAGDAAVLMLSLLLLLLQFDVAVDDGTLIVSGVDTGAVVIA
jgi:hypothetical protein